MTTCSNDYNLFEEVTRIHRSDENSPTPDRVDVVVANIRPKSCSPLIKELSRLLPLRSQLVPRSVAGDHRSHTTANRVHDEHFDDNRARDFDSIRDDGEKRDDTVTPIDLSHLKRVRRFPADGNDDDTKTSDSSPRRKKIKSLKSEQPKMLQVILGTPVSLYFLLRDSSICEGNKRDETPMLDHFKAKYNVELSIPWLLRAIDRPSVNMDDNDDDDDDDAEHNTDVVSVPGRGAQSKEELETWNKIWPSIYFHLKTEEHKKELAALEESEQEEMKNGIREAVRDAHLLRTRARRSASPSRDDGSGSRPSSLSSASGAVMRCPRTGSIVSRASDEILAAQLGRTNQTTTTTTTTGRRRNPLSTPVLLAIQGVSRTERAAAADKGLRSREFANGQYLCTGYDAYVTREPDVFEAMALVHSRVRRVVFAVPDTARGGLGGTGEANAVHCLPGTNHHYRVFRLATPRRSNDDDGGRRSDAETSLLALWEACRNLHSEDCEPPEINEIRTPKISSKQSSNKD